MGTMSFADFKKNAESLNKKLEETLKNDGNRNNDREPDDRLWYPKRGKDGNGSAVIRFLPARPPFYDLPYAKVLSYAFKNPKNNSWYIENSPATIGKECPAAEAYWRLKNSDDPADQALSKIINRRIEFYFNVYVIKDPLNPENEGQVKIMKGGQMWMNFIKAKEVPEFEDMERVPVFDFWKGATFRIRIKSEEMVIDGKKVQMPKYDASSWDSPSPLFDDDDKLEQIWEQMYDLSEFVDPKNIKDYDTLKKRLDKVLGVVSAPSEGRREEPKEVDKKVEEKPKTVESKLISDDDSDDFDFFKSLADDDDSIPF